MVIPVSLTHSLPAKRLPYADHVVVINEEGTIAEQGRFDVLAAAGGYVSSFNLPRPDWNYVPEEPAFPRATQDSISKEKQIIQTDEDLELEANRQTGDFSIYKYYLGSVGWIAVTIFGVCISSFVFCISFPSK
jgi:ATP-binding cassette subfamily C (CFTR/MRP) protein 1